MKKVIICLVVILIIVALICVFAFRKPENVESQVKTSGDEITKTAEIVDVPKNEQEGTAGSNMPLKDNYEEATREVSKALLNKFHEVYGDKIFDVRITNTKIYSALEEQNIPALKELNLSEKEIAFEATYELQPAKKEYADELSIPNGKYDEETGWVVGNTRVGVIKPVEDPENPYIIDNFGTGW